MLLWLGDLGHLFKHYIDGTMDEYIFLLHRFSLFGSLLAGALVGDSSAVGRGLGGLMLFRLRSYPSQRFSGLHVVVRTPYPKWNGSSQKHRFLCFPYMLSHWCFECFFRRRGGRGGGGFYSRGGMRGGGHSPSQGEDANGEAEGAEGGGEGKAKMGGQRGGFRRYRNRYVRRGIGFRPQEGGKEDAEGGGAASGVR